MRGRAFAPLPKITHLFLPRFPNGGKKLIVFGMMCSHVSKCCPKLAQWGLLALRLAVGFIFIYQGYGKLMTNHTMAVGMFGGLGFPAPEFWAYFVGLAELVGGLMIALGIFTRVAATWLAVILIVAILTVHRGGPVAGYFFPLSLLGAMLALAGVGAGDLRLVRAECLCGRCRMAGKEMDNCCGKKEMSGGSCCGAGEMMKKEDMMKK